jgi:capsular polysaccharide biosynthesis protein
MARFHLLRLSGIEPDYYVFPTHYAFNRECIELLEIPLEKIIPASNGSTIQADLLLVPSLINNWEFVDFDGYPHFQKQWLPSWLRNFYPQFKSAGCRKNRTRIYISRGDARYRRVANEEDVIDVLRSFGFVVCTPEKLSLPDQIEAFGAAEIVVAPHGAGLTNISFCPIDAVVLEFFSKHYLDSSYRLQSSVLGHRYYFMVDTETRLQSTAPLERDMVVNLTRLRRWLRLLGL